MILVLIPILILIGAYVMVYYFRTKYKYWQLRNVPCDPPTMFFGSFLRFFFEKDNLRKYLDRTGIKFDSPYYGFFIFNKPFLVIQDLDIVKRIMITDFASFSDKLFFGDKACDPVFNNSLFGTKGNEWRALRYGLSPVFSSRKLKGMFGLIAECGEHLIGHLKKISDQDVDVTDVLSRFSTEVISSCAFGVQCDCFQERKTQFQNYGENIFSKGVKGLIKNISYIFLHSVVKCFKFSFLNPDGVEYFRNVFREVLKERRAQAVRRNDFVDILLDLQKKGETGDLVLDDKKMLAQAIPFFAAGHETSTAIVSFTLHELSANKFIQERVRQEIFDKINNHGTLNFEVLNDMGYLTMVLSETLRKYPVISFIQRESVGCYTIPETGLQLEPRTAILVPMRSFHHNPKYFRDPDVYDPDRFKQLRDAEAFLAFGIGPRNCLGKRFALLTMKMVLVYILKHFIVEKSTKASENLAITSPHISRAVNGVNLKFRHIKRC